MVAVPLSRLLPAFELFREACFPLAVLPSRAGKWSASFWNLPPDLAVELKKTAVHGIWALDAGGLDAWSTPPLRSPPHVE